MYEYKSTRLRYIVFVYEYKTSPNIPKYRNIEICEISKYAKRRKGQSDSYRPMTMIAKVADVKSTSVSVHRLLEAGNRVHFEPGNCYVEHIEKGMRTRIQEKGGAFEVGFWVPRAKVEPTKGLRTMGKAEMQKALKVGKRMLSQVGETIHRSPTCMVI